MQRLASWIVVYTIAVLLLALIGVACLYVIKSTNDIHPAIVFGVGCGLYTMLVLYLMHMRAGTLSPSPEEMRSGGRGEETDNELL